MNCLMVLRFPEIPDFAANWMNQYPTVFLTLKDVDGLDFESAKSMLQRRIAELCRQYFYLTESEKVNPFDKKIFLQLVDVVDGKDNRYDAENKSFPDHADAS